MIDDINKKETTVDYATLIRNECDARITELLDKMPDYVDAYNNYRQGKTSDRSRKENLRDIYTFFQFLKQKNSRFKKMEIRDFPAEDLGMINAFDFDDYSGWLNNYTTPDGVTHHNDRVSIKRKLSSLRSFYQFLFVRMYISSDPSQFISMPYIPPKKAENTIILEKHERPLFFESFDRAIDDAKDKISREMNEDGKNKKRTLNALPVAVRNRTIVYLLIGTGIRVSELCAMNCSDFSRELGTINVIRKGGKKDTVYLSDTIMDYLLPYLDEYRGLTPPQDGHYDAMFLSEKGTRISVRSVELMVKQHADTALGSNNKISPHKLRATFGTEYYWQTRDIKATADAMGHSAIQTTSTYYVRDAEDAKRNARNIKF